MSKRTQRQRVNITLTPKSRRMLTQIAKKQGRSRSHTIEYLIVKESECQEKEQ